MMTGSPSAGPGRRLRRGIATLLALAVAGAVTAVLTPSAGAAIVAPVPLGTAAAYSVLAGTTVTNTGATVLEGNLGVSPGDAVVGFPPGTVNAPSTIQAGTAAAATAQADLTVAYDNAAGRPVTATVAPDLTGATLVGGVYAASANGPLGLTGTVTLDGQNDPSSVFIFQTGSTLITGAGSAVELINGAQECNVFWQVGSSATVAVNSTFRGNILALTSVTVQTGATVDGRALARNGAVTLDTNVFTLPGCDLTTTTTSGATSSSSNTSSSTPTTVAGPTTTVAPGATTTSAAGGSTTSTTAAPVTSTTVGSATSTTGGGTTTTTVGSATSTTGGGTTTTTVGSATSTTAAAAATSTTRAGWTSTLTTGPSPGSATGGAGGDAGALTSAVRAGGSDVARASSQGGSGTRRELARTGGAGLDDDATAAAALIALGALLLGARGRAARRPPAGSRPEGGRRGAGGSA
jgi:hypothetical protein